MHNTNLCSDRCCLHGLSGWCTTCDMHLYHTDKEDNCFMKHHARHLLFSAPTSSWISLIFPSLLLCILCVISHHYAPFVNFLCCYFFSHLWCCYHYYGPFLFCDVCLLVCLVSRSCLTSQTRIWLIKLLSLWSLHLSCHYLLTPFTRVWQWYTKFMC